MNPRIAPLIASLLVAAQTFTCTAAPIELWPGGVPGEAVSLPPESDLSKPTDGLVAGKPLIRLGNVANPTIEVFPAPMENATGAAVLVCPGGGYNILALDLEGTEVCTWLNSIGVTAVLLKYRVPRRANLEKHAAPLQDAQRAMGLIRAHAAEWKIDPQRVGCLGFSAGGHLAAVLSTQAPGRSYPTRDAADEKPSRPDFTVLIYPAYLTVKEKDDALSPELTVDAQTPATFIAQSQDDSVRVESSLFYYLALKNAKVPAELHLYPTGGHGYGLRPSEHLVTTWPARAAEWMRARGLLATKR